MDQVLIYHWSDRTLQWHTHSLSWCPAKPLPGKCLLYLIISIIVNYIQMSHNHSQSSLKTCYTTTGNATKHDHKTRRSGCLVWQCWGSVYPHDITALPTTPSSNSIRDLVGKTANEYNEETTTQRDLVQLQEHFEWFQENFDQLETAMNTPAHTEELADLTKSCRNWL